MSTPKGLVTHRLRTTATLCLPDRTEFHTESLVPCWIPGPEYSGSCKRTSSWEGTRAEGVGLYYCPTQLVQGCREQGPGCPEPHQSSSLLSLEGRDQIYVGLWRNTSGFNNQSHSNVHQLVAWPQQCYRRVCRWGQRWGYRVWVSNQLSGMRGGNQWIYTENSTHHGNSRAHSSPLEPFGGFWR